MTTSETHEFASPRWVAEAERYLRQAVETAGDRLAGLRFSVCETFTDAPDHLRQDGTDAVSWHLVIDGPTVSVGSGRLAGVDRDVVADYATVVPIAKTIYQDDPATLAAVVEHESAVTPSDASPGPAAPPKGLGRLLLDFHDHMARRTR